MSIYPKTGIFELMKAGSRVLRKGETNTYLYLFVLIRVLDTRFSIWIIP